MLLSRRKVVHLNLGFEGDVVRRGVIGRERDVVLWMVVLRGDPEDEPGQLKERVDQRGEVSATFDGERAVLDRSDGVITSVLLWIVTILTAAVYTHRRAEILLHIHDDQRGDKVGWFRHFRCHGELQNCMVVNEATSCEWSFIAGCDNLCSYHVTRYQRLHGGDDAERNGR